MRRPPMALIFAALVLAGASSAWAGGSTPGVYVDPNFPPLGGASPGVTRAAPTQPSRSQGARPPGWADNAPGRVRSSDRFARPQSGVVCDRRTNVCYKNGEARPERNQGCVRRPGTDRVEGIRKRNGTGKLFLPDRGVTCNSIRKVCYDDGVADFSQTRRYFGDRAADALN